MITLKEMALDSRHFELHFTGDGLYNDGRAVSCRGGFLSTDTFLNSFFIGRLKGFCDFSRISLHLSLDGQVRLKVYSSKLAGGPKLLAEKEAGNKSTIELNVEGLSEHDRLFFTLEGGSPFTLNSFSYTLDRQPVVTGKTAVVFCTYKKEDYISRNLTALRRLPSERFSIIIVDNAGTLEEPADENVFLFKNPNLGGAGGFTRGIVECLKMSDVSHILLMDDDVVVCPHTLLNLAGLFTLSEKISVVCGAMLDQFNPHQLTEHGADYLPQAFRARSALPAVNVSDPTNLDRLMLPRPAAYGGWWFYAFDKNLVSQYGLPLPLFIRGDDVEFGTRLSQAGHPPLVYPGLGVWHEPFYARSPRWITYYIIRNGLIYTALYSSVFTRVKTLVRAALTALQRMLFFDYYQAALAVRAMADSRRGPDFLAGLDEEALHRELMAGSDKTISADDFNRLKGGGEPGALFRERSVHPARAGRLRRLVAALCLNGHLFRPLWRQPAAGLLNRRESTAVIFGARHVRLFNAYNGENYILSMNRLAFFRLCGAVLWQVAAGLAALPLNGRTWRRKVSKLTETEMWQKKFDRLNQG